MKPHGEKKKARNVIGNKADLKSHSVWSLRDSILVEPEFHLSSLCSSFLFQELSLKLTHFFGGGHTSVQASAPALWTYW